MNTHKTGFWTLDAAPGRKRYWIIYATAFLLLLVGILAAKEAGLQTDLNMRREAAGQIRRIAEAIPADLVRKLSFSAEDVDRPEFQRLRDQIKAYAEASGIRSLYTMALRDGQLVFGPENFEPGHPQASPPGTVYLTPTKKDFGIFETGGATVQGPARDEYGDFVTATASVIDPRGGEVLMTVGIDIEAAVWQAEIRKAQWVPFLTAMAPLLMLALGFAALKVRTRLSAANHRRFRHIEAFTCAIIMLLLTGTVARLLHVADKKSQEENFYSQAQIKAEIYTTLFKNISHDLNMLVCFFESSDYISRQDFRTYCGPLIDKNPIRACFWFPEVSATDAAGFTARVRSDDLPEFSIWQFNEQNARIPAQGTVLYPEVYIEPLAGHEKALGYDLYSEPVRRAAIADALRTDRATATDPVTLIAENDHPTGLFILQPVHAKQGLGMAGFSVSPKALLESHAGGSGSEISGLSVSLVELRAGRPPLWLACSRKDCYECETTLRTGLYSSTPVFAFGKTYDLLITPEKQWLEAHPLHAGQTALFTGLILTLLLTTLVAILSNRPFLLEQLIQRRTAELLRLSTAINQSPEAVVITGTDGTIQYANPAFERITGYSLEEAIGKNMRLIKSGQHDAGFYSSLWKTITAGNIWYGRFTNKKKNGELYTEEASISPVRDPSGEIGGYVAVKRDITGELAREEKFQQSQKMEAIGQLAGGVAHDFNNILQAILGFCEILQTRMKTDTVEHRNVNEIHKAALRAAELTRQLLAFSRKQPVDKKLFNLNSAVRDAEVLLDMLLGEKTRCVFDLAPDLQPVHADQGQITQIIMNLAINARDAMPAGGRLSIATENIAFDSQAAAGIPEAEAGTFACLSVTDTGTGMSQEVKNHLFEPFFTTKEVGKGTGLGLAVVYGIVKQSNGWIHVYSEEGHGTTVKIYLPASRPAETAPVRHGQANQERILLVDDDTDARNLVLRILTPAGYEVAAAASAEEALQLFEQDGPGFDLLFSDVVLPGKNGVELADIIREKNPGIPVLLYSGYRDPYERWSDLDRKGYRFLQKPFGVTSLIAAVHDTLAERTG
ncbi:MAG: PAS domain S-box protein [Kiritimatiellaceae bacterium]|nr:PAS domain S-box protein [Kiritimatiellaceae bacterium]